MKRLLCLILCMLLAISILPQHAHAKGQLHTVLCYSPSSPYGILCTFLLSDGYIYMDAHAASVITGYDVVESVPGSATFSSGNRTVTHTGSSVSDSGRDWYCLESLMSSLNTRVSASRGHLLFNPSNIALNALYETMDGYERMTIAADPGDASIAVGLFFSKLYNVASTFNITSLFGNRYERKMYRTAFYALMRRSSDTYSTTIGDLCSQAEDEILSPLSSFFNQMGETFSEEVMDAFYSGTELEMMKEFVNAYQSYSDVLTMSPAELYKLMEEAAFYNGAFDAGATGLSFMLDHNALDGEEEILMDVMQQILGTYQKNTADQLKSVVFDTAMDIGAAHVDQLLRDALLGKAGELLVSGVDAVMQQLPGVSSMDELEMAAIYFQIQELARIQIETAYEHDDYLRLKYAGIIYYRCAYLAAAEIGKMDDSVLQSLARDLMVKLSELEADLLSISDHQILQQGCINDEIPARALTGPHEEYISFYESLIVRYGELNEKDYFGTTYIEEGCGVIAPWLSSAGGKTLLVVLRQEYNQLIQMVYQDTTGNADFTLLDERVVLTCGANGSAYQGFDRAGALLACSSMDTSLTAYVCTGISIETHQYSGNPSADSISAMRQDARNQLAAAFGSHTPGFEVDGSDGLFKISHSPAELRALFIEGLNDL